MVDVERTHSGLAAFGSHVTRLFRGVRGRYVLPQTTFLVFLCAIDAAYTLVAVRLGWARETNPLLIGTLEHSDAMFLMVKGATFLLPLSLLEILRPLRPEFIAQVIRAGALGYIAIYLIGSVLVHLH